MTLTDQLMRDEGVVLHAYRDALGNLTIGVGHNLDAKGISHRAVMVILADDINDARHDLVAALPWVTKLDMARQDALTNMCFNMGIVGLQGFTNMLAALQAGDWATAAREALQSKWATQVGERATRLAHQFETGTYQ